MSPAETLERVNEKLRAKELELQQTSEALQRELNDQLLFEQMVRAHRTREKELTKELRELAEKLNEANEELKRKDRIKDEFISVASHELRTPVQTILGFAELAKGGLIDQQEAWDGVIRGCLRLRKVATDIIAVSRIESGQLTYVMEKFRINHVILDLVNSVKLGLNINVLLETNLDSDIEIAADKDRMTQVLGNIMDNAVKFTKEGRIKVETRNLAEEKKIEIKVSDTGGGIHEDVLPRLFEKFVAKSDQGENQHGTGLGLFISKAIVTAHKGEISAYNNYEGGATFVIVLPIDTSQ